jgi:hypothetical protein
LTTISSYYWAASVWVDGMRRIKATEATNIVLIDDHGGHISCVCCSETARRTDLDSATITGIYEILHVGRERCLFGQGTHFATDQN